MKFIDTHTHLYLPDFKEDIDAVIERAIADNVVQFFLPGIESNNIEDILLLESRFPDNCHAMMGLHPCSVNQNYENELAVVHDWLNKRPFCAIGEIGLDYYWDTTYKAEQIKCFENQMQWALEKDLPIVIHTRNAMSETIETVRPFAQKGLKGIFHCFGGTKEEAKEIIHMNFLLGIGGVLTYKKSGLDEAIKDIDLSHIVLETDSPYLTPVPYRGKRNESAYIKIIAQKLADIKNTDIEQVANITTANALRIFKL